MTEPIDILAIAEQRNAQAIQAWIDFTKLTISDMTSIKIAADRCHLAEMDLDAVQRWIYTWAFA